MGLSKKQREAVYAKSGGVCWYCGTDLEKGWHADHFEPLQRLYQFSWVDGNGWTREGGRPQRPERDTIANMVPACPSCNNYKHNLSVEEFRQAIATSAERLRRAHACFRFGERYGVISVSTEPVTFWFEQHQDQPHDP